MPDEVVNVLDQGEGSGILRDGAEIGNLYFICMCTSPWNLQTLNLALDSFHLHRKHENYKSA